LFGVSDLKSLVEGFPAYWMAGAESIYRKFGDPKNPADAQYQHDRSPLYFLDKVARPIQPRSDCSQDPLSARRDRP
jgi:hypothetical protein